MPLCLAVEDLWRVKIRARLGEDAQYWYAHLKIDQKTFSKSHTRHFHIIQVHDYNLNRVLVEQKCSFPSYQVTIHEANNHRSPDEGNKQHPWGRIKPSVLEADRLW